MDPLLDVVKKTWGYDGLRPLQREAMQASIDGRDALVVLPTGGGKSLCYQAPALLAEGLTVVVSPLISLMKDQVDSLIGRGVGAAFLNSSLEPADRNRVQAAVARGEYRLLFVAPERFAAAGFDRLLGLARVRAFAIDEAHCISHWGHDFRADYRELGRLKREFPDAPVHAFTATATPRVRDDVVEQLGLKNPDLLVGDFYRPNLHFRVAKRADRFQDVIDEVRQRCGLPGIVYCIRRRDVDELAKRIENAVPYHAGMDDEARTRAQELWIEGKADVVVATVAFGMGIDRADVRYVIHAAMPQSLEHYQQEAGRAGRDGKPSACILFYSGADFRMWQSISESQPSADAESKMQLLSQMYRFCAGTRCRHRSLVEYFGQRWTGGPCDACDACDGSMGRVADSAGTARRILGCVARTGQRYGAAYLSEILSGQVTDRVEQRGHREIEDFGALSETPRGAVRDWIQQLIDGDRLVPEGEYNVIRLLPAGLKVLRGEEEVALFGGTERSRPRPARKKSKKKQKKKKSAVTAPDTGEPEDPRLVEMLRRLRREISDSRNLPAFMIFSDATLRALARLRPSTPEELLDVPGFGPAKTEMYGPRILKEIDRNQTL